VLKINPSVPSTLVLLLPSTPVRLGSLVHGPHAPLVLNHDPCHAVLLILPVAPSSYPITASVTLHGNQPPQEVVKKKSERRRERERDTPTDRVPFFVLFFFASFFFNTI